MKCLIFLVILVVSTTAFPVENLSGSARIDLGLGTILNKQDILAQLIPERPKGREQAVLEVPSAIQQVDLIYDKAQKAVINFLHPKPIVDTISEHEKYGNNGDQFRSIGNAIVGGYEGFSNFINAAVDLPFESMKQVTRKATSYLSTIGAKLVGL